MQPLSEREKRVALVYEDFICIKRLKFSSVVPLRQQKEGHCKEDKLEQPCHQVRLITGLLAAS